MGVYTATDTGVDDLLDLQGNGRTQLVDMQFDLRLLITNLYQVKGRPLAARTRLVYRLSYPALTRFNHHPRRTTIKPIAGRNPQTDDLLPYAALFNTR
ncbi:hypothetical protein KCP69_08665 [Salmonella enterica subsp. enterica]|nr:hypothetical protein KCP69_08665 [Salmonella enterica subsp. enterica]